MSKAGLITKLKIIFNDLTGKSADTKATEIGTDIYDEVTGIVPIGTILDWHKDFTGTPSLPDNFVECNGQTLDDEDSPYDGQVIPNLNGDSGGADLDDGVNDNLGKTGEIFLKSDTTSGKTELDRFQGWQLGAKEDNTGAMDYWGRAAIRGEVVQHSTSANYTYPLYHVGIQGDSRMLMAMNDGTNGNPRTGADTKPRSFSIVKIMRIK